MTMQGSGTGNEGLTKKEIRRLLIKQRNSLKAHERKEKDGRILEILTGTEEYKESGIVLLYASYNGEADTMGIMERCIKDGKRIACPVSSIRENVPSIDFYYINKPEELIEGYMGIMEPDPSGSVRVTCEEIERSLLVLPMTGYDRKRNRLGYGKGFYDRFLASNRVRHTAALAYTCQEADELPADVYDVKPEMIITENGIIR